MFDRGIRQNNIWKASLLFILKVMLPFKFVKMNGSCTKFNLNLLLFLECFASVRCQKKTQQKPYYQIK